jgi:putative tryptophan/tyrosine transport system substrate-binding protein
MRTALTLALALGIFTAPLAAGAQSERKIPHIGYLANPSGPTVDAFRQGLRELGYVEGQNIILEYRWAEGRIDQFPALAAQLVQLKVDLIVVSSTPAALAAKQATATIPIVMTVGADPVGSGLVASLRRPGGNVTGLSNLAEDLIAKLVELLKAAIPRVSRVAVLANPRNQVHPTFLRGVDAAARALNVQLFPMKARDPAEFDGAFSAMVRERVGALIVLPDPTFVSARKEIVDLAAKKRLPAIYGFREFADAGGLMAYGVNLADNFRRAARYVDKILKGAKPADLPVEQPTRFELVINLKTARALGLTIPQSVLARADHVIQ